jgi:uncharacterized protein with HEPN domain
MQLRVKSLLYDIQQAIELTERFTLRQSFEAYADDPMRRAAVERQLAIIGEALNQLIRVDPATAARISEHRRVIGLRNILVHSYARVDDRVIWSIVQDKLPGLRHEVEELLTDN